MGRLINGEAIEINNILKNPELFKEYLRYRAGFSEEKQMPILNIKDQNW